MALYKYSSYITNSSDSAFDTIYEPGGRGAHSGIYRCEGCGKEISHTGGSTLPPQSHHQHTTAQGKIRWRMAVYAQTGS